MRKQFKFQRKNGNIAEGSIEIAIKNHIAEIEEKDVTPAVKLLIEANGGAEVKESKSKKKRKVNPVKWPKEENKLRPTSEFIDEVAK